MCQSNLECSQWNCTSHRGGKNSESRESCLEWGSRVSNQSLCLQKFITGSFHTVMKSDFLHSSHFCISGYFCGMFFCGFFGFLWSFTLQKSTFAGRTLYRWHLKHLQGALPVRAERNLGNPAHRAAQPGAPQDLGFPEKSSESLSKLWCHWQVWEKQLQDCTHFRNLFSSHWFLNLQKKKNYFKDAFLIYFMLGICSKPFLQVKILNSSNSRYTQNGILHMLDRNKRIKPRPERFQNCKDVFDLILTCEERVYDQVVEGKELELINQINSECFFFLQKIWKSLWLLQLQEFAVIDVDLCSRAVMAELCPQKVLAAPQSVCAQH